MLEGIRGVDKLGRIVLPPEIRKALDLRAKEKLYISYDGKEIVIKKQEKLCVFCRSDEISEELGGKYICQSCISKLGDRPKL